MLFFHFEFVGSYFVRLVESKTSLMALIWWFKTYSHLGFSRTNTNSVIRIVCVNDHKVVSKGTDCDVRYIENVYGICTKKRSRLKNENWRVSNRENSFLRSKISTKLHCCIREKYIFVVASKKENPNNRHKCPKKSIHDSQRDSTSVRCSTRGLKWISQGMRRLPAAVGDCDW